jgi:hypothetical protein
MPEPSTHPAPPAIAPAAVPLPDWLPPDDVGLRITQCGVYFDAVRVPERLGAVALELLGVRSGPVIANRRDGVLYWLIAPGAAEGWQLPVTVYGPACYLSVPSAAPCGIRSVHWLTPPEGSCLTDPEALHDALTEAAAVLLGPRPEATR